MGCWHTQAGTPQACDWARLVEARQTSNWVGGMLMGPFSRVLESACNLGALPLSNLI
jgi:hypothetical protein